jgi:hypothetical protein
MVISPMGLGKKIYCTGEDKQHFSSQSAVSRQSDSQLYGHESRRTRIEESLKWRGQAEI